MISLPSVIDKGMAPPGKSVISLQSPASMKLEDNWRTKNGKRNKKYLELKEMVGDILIRNSEKIIPGLSKKIDYRFTASPLTLQRYTLNSMGCTAGWTYNPYETFNNGMKGVTAFKTPVKNLYQVGHWAMSPGGAPSGFMTGKFVSSIIRQRMKWGL